MSLYGVHRKKAVSFWSSSCLFQLGTKIKLIYDFGLLARAKGLRFWREYKDNKGILHDRE